MHAGSPGTAAASVGGVSFTRWGRTTCPDTNDTELLYQGTMAGSAWNEAGSAEYQCLHQQPQFLQTTAGRQGERSRIHGTEYRALDSPPAFSDIVHHDAPCSVCYASTRIAKITIPGRTSCPPLWTMEYNGYLMTDKLDTNHRSRVPVCVDVNAETVPESAIATTTSLLYFIETTCTGIDCPPYADGSEVACVVCTK